jgi:hypothetical protein
MFHKGSRQEFSARDCLEERIGQSIAARSGFYRVAHDSRFGQDRNCPIRAFPPMRLGAPLPEQVVERPCL